jgi:hypothetical protein
VLDNLTHDSEIETSNLPIDRRREKMTKDIRLNSTTLYSVLSDILATYFHKNSIYNEFLRLVKTSNLPINELINAKSEFCNFPSDF